MIVDEVNRFYLRKIPKKIEKELKDLKYDEIQIEGGKLSWIYNEGVEAVNDGLRCLKERWIKYIDSENPAEEFIKKKELQLQECAEIIDRLTVLLLNPPLPQPKPTSINLSESREDISLFGSEEERKQAIKEAVEKFEKSISNRDFWISLASDSLTMCNCSENAQRSRNEKELVKAVIERYPPHASFELCLMSLGSGGLMQDWLLLQWLVNVGYSKIYLHLIDPMTTNDYVVALQKLISCYLNHSIKVVHSEAYFDPESIEKCRPCHVIHAFDFDSILYYPCSWGAWKSLLIASECLKNQGLLFCSAYGKQYWFDAQLGEWNLPRNADINVSLLAEQNQGRDITFVVTDDEYFWQETFYYLAKLRLLKRNIKVLIIKSEPHKSDDELYKMCATVKKILIPHNEIDLTIEYSSQIEATVCDVFYASNLLIDETLLRTYIPQVRDRGIVILNPRSCYQRESDMRKKAQLINAVHNTIESIKECAQVLALSHSLQLKFIS